MAIDSRTEVKKHEIRSTKCETNPNTKIRNKQGIEHRTLLVPVPNVRDENTIGKVTLFLTVENSVCFEM